MFHKRYHNFYFGKKMHLYQNKVAIFKEKNELLLSLKKKKLQLPMKERFFLAKGRQKNV